MHEEAPTEPIHDAPGRSYERERREGTRAIRGLLLAGVVAIAVWAVVATVVLAIVVMVPR